MENGNGVDRELLERIAVKAKPSTFEANPRSFVQRMQAAQDAMVEGRGLDDEIGLNLATTTRLYETYLTSAKVAMAKVGRPMVARYAGTDIITGETFEAGENILWWPFMKVATRA